MVKIIDMLKILQAIVNLTRAGALKSIDQVYNLAKRELGNKFNSAKKQIDDAFKKGQEQKKIDDRTKELKKIDEEFDLEKGLNDLDEFNVTKDAAKAKELIDQRTDDLMGKKESEGIMDVADKMSKKAEEMKKLLDENKVTQTSIFEDALDAATGFKKTTGSKDKNKPFRTHSMEYKKENPDYRVPGGSMYAEGNLRTAIRQFLRTEAKEGKIKLSKDDQWRIDNYSPMMEDDPIDVFRRYYGEDALEAASDMANELRFGESYKHYEEIFRREMPELKIKTEGAGQYDQSILDAERIMKEAAEEAKNKKVLEEFDIIDRKKNNMGGIMRSHYAFGTGKKLVQLFGGVKKLKKAIKDAVDNLNRTGDKKLDADMAVDDMLEEAGIDRDTVDQYDLIDAYGKAYDEIVRSVDDLPGFPKIKSQSSKNVFDEVDVELEKQFPGVTKEIQSSKTVERLKLMEKYPGIDNKLLDQILIDDNPQRKAEVLATLDEAFRMMEKGIGPDEILETFKKTPRTKQAMGTGPDGLSEITELFKKIKIKNENKRAEKEADKQVRYRKLIESNKFPELNEFFQAKLNESNGDMDLELRTNFAVGSSPFTAEQLAQKRQQSYIDYLARQGKGTSTTGTGTSTSGVNNISVFKPPTSLVPSTTTTGTGTSGTSTTTGGTSGGGTTSSGGGYSGGSSGGGSSGGGSTGSSGGGTSSGGGNVYTGAGNFPPGMGTNTGGGSAGSSGGSSGLTPNTGNVDVGGGGFGGTGSIVGGGTGSAPGYQSRLDEYKAYVERNKNDPTAALSPNSFFTQKELLASPELQDAAYKDVYNPAQEYQKQVQAGYDTGDLGSEAANDAANKAASALPNPYEMSSKELRAAAQPFIEQAKAEWFAANPGATAQDFSRSGGRWIDLAEDIVRRNYREQQDQFAATADDGFEIFTDDKGIKRITQDQYNQAKLEFLKSEGKIDQNATVNDLGKQEGGPRNEDLNLAAKEYIENKYGTSSTLSPNPKTGYEQMGGGADFAQITSLPETTQFAQSIQGETNNKNILQKANEFATKHGKSITTASYLLDYVAPGVGKTIRYLQAANKGYNTIKDAYNQSIDDVLTKPTGIGGQIDLNETLSKGTTPEPEYDGNIGSIFFRDGGRVNKAVGGPLDLEARRKQSYEDYLARQGGVQPKTPTAPPAQPVVPQPKPNFPKPFPMTPGPSSNVPFGQKPATPTTPATTAAQPQPAGPFDMSKYQGGTFTGGVEDSRNIALNELAELGVDIDKYRTMTAKKDPTAPTFKGYTNTELMVMSPEEFKQKLGFDPSVEGANPEFEKFIQLIGPMAIGPSGPAGVKTEFKNQDELAQILNRAIPFYMRTARDLGENYTLQEMLAMSDEELAALDDRYDKKMGYGKYRKTSPNIYNTGSRDKSQAQETMEYYSSNIQPKGTGIGLGSQYATGGRVGFRYGGEDAKVKKYMKTDYSNPFNRLTKRDIGRHQAYNSAVLKKGKKMISADKKKKKNLLTLNEQARAKALQRLALLKRLYGGV